MRKKQFSKLVNLIIFFTALVPLILVTSKVEAVAQVHIGSNIGYIDSLGYYNVVGEVQNIGDQAVRYVKVSATFYDSVDTVVGTSFTFSRVDVLLVGRKSPFRIILLDTSQSLKIDHYSLNVDFVLTTSLPIGLEILSHSSYIDSIGYMHIVGEVENIATGKATYVKVIATCYDEADKVVDVSFTFSNPSDIEAGQKAPFEILIMSEKVETVASYELTAESMQYSEIPEFNSCLFLLLFLPSITFAFFFLKRRLAK